MAETLTIRLEERDRVIRDLAEAEARRLNRAAIRADGERVVAYLEQHPQAKAELETYGTPIGNLP